jgi:integrase/recombinase XerD
VSDIDSRRMMIRVERGKRGAGRDLPLSPVLLETLREYWRWKKTRIYLFPSSTHKRGPGHGQRSFGIGISRHLPEW